MRRAHAHTAKHGGRNPPPISQNFCRVLLVLCILDGALAAAQRALLEAAEQTESEQGQTDCRRRCDDGDLDAFAVAVEFLGEGLGGRGVDDGGLGRGAVPEFKLAATRLETGGKTLTC